MVIDASERFAKRVAEWMNSSGLNTLEMSQRLSRFPDDFIRKVVYAHRKLVKERGR